ncbi:MAG: ABC transporter permease [Spirochaetaceae bacterium]|nr:MAG: ABC transporter permease [Spirochaetaceae bacterium]
MNDNDASVTKTENAPGSETVAVASTQSEPDILVASQWKLVWWKFRKHKLAMISLAIVAVLYTTVIFAEFLAPRLPRSHSSQHVYVPPQRIRFFSDGRFELHVLRYTFERDPLSLQRIWTLNEDDVIPIGFFVRGQPYRMWGLFPAERRLLGPKNIDDPFFLMGTDGLGRDVFSRMIYSARVSLTVGLVGVTLTFILGILIGGISGLIGGRLDNFIQRVIEIVLSIPHLPFWLALAAMVPIHWSPLQTYMMITVILAFLSWTGLARVVRSKFLSLRDEDFVLAARLDGCSKTRLITRHMLPSFASHIIASITLTIPGVIIGETALSFLGLGLRPPVVSWGVMLQDAQRVAAMADHPWLLWPAAAVFVTVLALNYLGDGLRDAADPYAS